MTFFRGAHEYEVLILVSVRLFEKLLLGTCEMMKLYYFSLYIKIFVPFYMNHCLVAAKPLIGEKVVEAKNGEFPSVVSLGKAPGNNVAHHFCTGTLITKKHVLTAAHCVVNNETKSYMKPRKMVVTVGSSDVTQGAKYKVEKWKVFGKWAAKKRISIFPDEKLYHDIAVVTLADDVVEDIKPAQLSSLNYKSVYNKTVVAAGWGTTNFNATLAHLLRADLQVLDRETCLQNLIATGYNPDLVAIDFCTIARPPVSLGCGDSGGPLFVNGDEIIGVNVVDCEEHEHPNQQNVHAAVKFYMQFIRSVLKPKPHCEKLPKIEYTLNGFYDEE